MAHPVLKVLQAHKVLVEILVYLELRVVLFYI
jgi:hypothetical protein